jgi:hypothetical protein
VAATNIFWPDHLDHVKAIAMRGLSDDEMAPMLGISPTLLESWKAYYPSFAVAIDEGRTFADAQVIQALYNNAVGFEYETDEVVRTRRGADVVTVKKRALPETQAQKFWLANRSSYWRGEQNHAHRVGNMPGEQLGVSVETKMQVIHSILNMITPRPDNER